jgi:hypothetical protein
MGDTHITLTNYQRLILWLQSYVVIGKIKKVGWSKEANLYAFTCPKHGLVSSHVKGYRERLDCPHCWEELKKQNDASGN